MFLVKLRLKSDGALLRYGLGAPARLLNALVAAVLLAVSAFGGFSPVPMVLACAAALLALYREEWVFDPEGGRIRSFAGLPLLARWKARKLQDCGSIRLETAGGAGKGGAPAERGLPPGRFEHRLLLEGPEGLVILDMGRGRGNLERLRGIGSRIAAHIGKPFIES